MNMLNVKDIKEVYRLKTLVNDCENNHECDIYIAANDAIIWEARIGTDADTYTGGEATRRFERAMRDLEILLGN